MGISRLVKGVFIRLLSTVLRNKQIALCVLGILAFILICDISGLHRHFFEENYKKAFKYPIEAEDFVEIVHNFRDKQPTRLQPINHLYSEIKFASKAEKGCPGPYDFLILVKSAPGNFDNRDAIRTTWKLYARLPAKIIFFIGSAKSNLDTVSAKLKDSYTSGVLLETTVKEALDKEVVKHDDIVLLDFVDSYYNNTIKTMMELRWAVEICNEFRYALLVDDDYYVSLKNLAAFVHDPKTYPKLVDNGKVNEENTLYAGFRMFSPPHRHKIGTKWFTPLAEYPFDYFPPYITAGAILLSKQAVFDIYYASFFVKHFRFDDIFIAICAKKMNIKPINSKYFRFWSVGDEHPEEFLVASHGFRDPDRLFKFWNAQRALEFT